MSLIGKWSAIFLIIAGIFVIAWKIFYGPPIDPVGIYNLKGRFEHFAENGLPSDKLLIGRIFQLGWWVGVDDKKALALYVEAAKKGDRKAQLFAGINFYQGTLGVKDYSKAYYWFNELAEAHDSEGQFWAGLMLWQGWTDRAPDLDQALNLLRRSAEANNPRALGFLADLYFLGKKVPVDTAQAIRLMRRSAQNANEATSDVVFNYAWLFVEGKQVPQNNEEALRWLRRSAELGSVRGGLELGQVYYFGKLGQDTDLGESVRWLRQPAVAENGKAQLLLAEAERRRGAIAEALGWLVRASLNSDTEVSKEAMRRLEGIPPLRIDSPEFRRYLANMHKSVYAKAAGTF